MPLVLVGTPIGNIGDLSPRAAGALAAADCICCEDLRKARRLLEAAEVPGADAVPLIQIDDHSEAGRIGPVLDRLRRGEQVVVITDAGMPGIADPGERLVRVAGAEGIDVQVVPGPSAAVAALVVSGLPTGRFAFEGFLPRKGSGRAERLAELRAERRTIVLFETPHHVARTLGDLAEALGGERRVVLVRELTKLHEDIRRTTLAEAAGSTSDGDAFGELVVVVEGAPAPEGPGEDDVADAVQAALDEGLTVRDAAARVAADLGVPKRRAYDLAVALRAPRP